MAPLDTTGTSTRATPCWTDLAAAPPGHHLLRQLGTADPAALAAPDLLDAIVCSDRLLSHIHALQTRLLTEFARPGRAGDISDLLTSLTTRGSTAVRGGQVDVEVLDAVVTDHARGMAAAETAAALRLSPITARHRLDTAIDLHTGLPTTWQALHDGRIDRACATVIAEGTSVLNQDDRAHVEHQILPLATTRTPGRLRPLIDRAVITANPDAAQERADRARHEREVTHHAIKNQMSLIKAVLPAAGAVTVYTLIDLLAGSTSTPGDDRGIAARRADALTDLATELLTHGHLDLTNLITPGEVHHGDGQVMNHDGDTEDGDTVDGEKVDSETIEGVVNRGRAQEGDGPTPDDAGSPTGKRDGGKPPTNGTGGSEPDQSVGPDSPAGTTSPAPRDAEPDQSARPDSPAGTTSPGCTGDAEPDQSARPDSPTGTSPAPGDHSHSKTAVPLGPSDPGLALTRQADDPI